MERRRYIQMIGGFRRLQLLSRNWLARRKTAAVVIQSVVRIWLERRRLHCMHHSAVVIQVMILLSALT